MIVYAQRLQPVRMCSVTRGAGEYLRGGSIMNLLRKLQIFLFGVLMAACAPIDGPYGGRGWELLGERNADFKVDRDRIDVGRREGRFSELRLAVRGAPVEVYDMVVTFAD